MQLMRIKSVYKKILILLFYIIYIPATCPSALVYIGFILRKPRQNKSSRAYFDGD